MRYLVKDMLDTCLMLDTRSSINQFRLLLNISDPRQSPSPYLFWQHQLVDNTSLVKRELLMHFRSYTLEATTSIGLTVLCKIGEAIFFTRLLNKETKADIVHALNLSHNITTATVLHEKVQELINDPREEYDVIIAEWMYSELYSGFSAVFNCPFIWSSSMEPYALVLSLIDEDPNPAYVVDHFSTNTPPLNFWERVKELWALIVTKYNQWLLRDMYIDLYETAFKPAATKRGHTLPPFDEIKYNASMMLGNSHASSGQAIRLPQNYVNILGYHIEKEIQPLPEDLKKIMDNAEHGIIYFSMGSNLQSKNLPADVKKGLLKMFGEFKQTVLWKLEETLPDVPKNVHIRQWLPQQSILAHFNCALFITHGGLLSTTESIHFGVPIIGIPIFADQFFNVGMAAKKGYGKRIEYSFNVVNELRNAINDVLNNSSYNEKAKELSAIYHDRLISPGKELVYWVEYVVRTRGAKHLRSPALAVPLYQKLYLDLIIVIIFIIIILQISITQLIKLLTVYSFKITKNKELKYSKNKVN